MNTAAISVLLTETVSETSVTTAKPLIGATPSKLLRHTAPARQMMDVDDHRAGPRLVNISKILSQDAALSQKISEIRSRAGRNPLPAVGHTPSRHPAGGRDAAESA